MATRGKWNSKKFLDALETMSFTPPELPATPAVVPISMPTSNFGQYMAARAYGVPQAGQLANTIGQQSDSGWKSALSQTFGWLGSLGTGLENFYFDIADEPKGGLSGGLDVLKNEAKDVGRTAISALQPVQELAMIPGIKVPGEGAYDKWEANQLQKFHVRDVNGTPTAVTGSNILGDVGVHNKVAKALGGFGLDVASDPTSYIGGAIFKGAARGSKALTDALAPATSKLAKAAAELPDETTRVAAAAAQPEIPAALGEDATQLAAPGLMQQTVKAGAPPVDLGVGELAVRGGKVPQFTEFNPGELRVRVPGRIAADLGYDTPVAKTLPTKSFQKFYNLTSKSGQVVGKRGINPSVADKAVQRVALATGDSAPVYNPVAGATGAGLQQAKKIADRFTKTALSGNKELNPATQAKMYNQIYKETAKSPMLAKLGSEAEKITWRRQEALRQLKSAEDHLAANGVPGTNFEGTQVRLSEVIGQFGNGIDPEPILKAFATKGGSTNEAVQNIINKVTAARAAQTGGVAKVIYDGLSPTLNDALENLAPKSFDDVLRGAQDQAFQMAKTQGLTNAEASHVKDLIKEWTGQNEVGSWSLQHVVSSVTPKMAKKIIRGEATDKEVDLVRRAVSHEVDMAMGRVTPATIADRVRIFTTLNFTTWLGRGDYADAFRTEYSFVEGMARARASAFSAIAKDSTKDARTRAFVAAQRPELLAALPEDEQQLAQGFRDYFENIFSTPNPLRGKGLKDFTDVEGSVAFRSGLTRKDVNDALRSIGSRFQFRDVKEGDWTTSWRNFDPTTDVKADPVLFMYNLDVAVHRTLAKYNIMDDFAEQFGRKVGQAGYDPTAHTVSFPYGTRIDPDILFPKQYSEQFAQLLRDYDKGPWKPNSPQMRMLTTGLRKWKSAVTVFYPSHHIRNLMGDTWLMWMSGINDPTVFNRAFKIMGSQQGRYGDIIRSGDFSELAKFIGGGYREPVANDLITDIRGAKINASEYYGEMYNRGVLKKFGEIEDLYGDTSLNLGLANPKTALQRAMAPLGGAGKRAAGRVSEVREHYIRLAHTVGYVEKRLKKTPGLVSKLAKTTDPMERASLLKPLFDDAAKEIRKWHPDGTDMTYFEQKWMRNIIPFYSWQRKAVPLMLEGMFMSPAKILAYPRGMNALQVALGIQNQGTWDPFPQDKIFPDWMYAGAIGPIGDPQSNNPYVRFFGKLGRQAVNPLGGTEGSTIVDPGASGIPFNSFISQFGSNNPGIGSALSGLTSSINPAISIPADLLRNRTQTGSPISKDQGGAGYPGYFLGQLPQTSLLQRFTRIGKKQSDSVEPGPDWEALINTLTAAGLTGSGQYEKTAQFQEKARAKKNAAPNPYKVP